MARRPPNPEPTTFRCVCPADDEQLPVHVATRNVWWVLRSAGATGVLLLGSLTVMKFAYCLAAERALSRAAAAGLAEADLPRATSQSVERAIRRQLGQSLVRIGKPSIFLVQNGRPVRGLVSAGAGGHTSLTVAAEIGHLLPDWLRVLKLWQPGAGEPTIRVHFERHAGRG